MSKDVNDTNDAATSPVVVETQAYEDPMMMILEGLQPSDDQPTLDAVAEEETEGSDDTEEVIEDQPVEDILEEAVQNDADDEEVETVEEDDDPNELVVETEEDDDTNVEETEETEEEEEADAWFFTGHHSEYKTVDEAKKGIEAKDAYIIELENTVKGVQERAVAAEGKVAVYAETISEEAMRAAAVQSLLPEEYRGKTNDDFEDDADLRNFWKAELKAEADYDARQAKLMQEAQAQADAQAGKSKEAAKFVRDVATTSFFGVVNPEGRNELRKVLTEKDERGYTPLDRARMITEVFGEADGRKYLDGLRLQIQGEDEEVSTTSRDDKSKKVVAKKLPPKKVVQRVKKTVVKKKVPTTPPPKESPRDKFTGASAVDIIAAGLK